MLQVNCYQEKHVRSWNSCLLKENYVNESDPRSNVHYLSSSENKAWTGFTVNSFSDVKGLTKDAIFQEHNCSVTFKNVLEVAVSCWVIPESIYK